MNKLFIASTFSDTVNLFVKLVPKGKVVFVANASDQFKDKSWVNADRSAFVNNGFDVIDVDLREIASKELSDILSNNDILHICGGSALYIIDLLRRKKMISVIINAINNGMVYTGTSAGSMILAPDLSFCADDEDEKEAKMVGKIKNLKGIGLIDFYLMCHAQEKQYIPSTKRAMNNLPYNKMPILFLNDNMALWFEGNKFQLLKN
jgi:dipeptidase E